jgi:predicted Zn finger-like uncharacterized protein
MIVNCPSCSANYRIKAEIIDPQKGRVVRCSACGNNWRVFTPNSSASAPSVVTRESPENTQSKPKKQIHKHYGNNDKASKASILNKLFFIICFNIVVFTFGYLFRKDIVKIFPQTERFYQVIGVDVTITGISLVMPYLEKINHSDGRVSLIIQGSFLNSHPHDTLKIPPLKIILLNEANLPVASFIQSNFKPNSLLSGGRSDFSYEIPALPKEAVDVRIEFVSSEPEL